MPKFNVYRCNLKSLSGAHIGKSLLSEIETIIEVEAPENVAIKYDDIVDAAFKEFNLQAQISPTIDRHTTGYAHRMLLFDIYNSKT